MIDAIPLPASRPRASLVIVDDDESCGISLADYLRHHGYAAKVFTCGRQALRYLRNHAVDLVITDLYMPDFDGIELIRGCRSLNPRPRLLVMTGGMPDLLKAARFLGASGTLLKPVKPDRLLKTLEELTVAGSITAPMQACR